MTEPQDRQPRYRNKPWFKRYPGRWLEPHIQSMTFVGQAVLANLECQLWRSPKHRGVLIDNFSALKRMIGGNPQLAGKGLREIFTKGIFDLALVEEDASGKFFLRNLII